MSTPASVHAQDLRVLRTGVIATALLLPLAAGLGAVASGGRAALGGAVGVLVVAVFFSISMVVVVSAGRVSPQAMFQAAMTSYLIKVPVLAVMLLGLAHVVHPKALAWSVVGSTLIWLAIDIRLVLTSRMPYVLPEETTS